MFSQVRDSLREVFFKAWQKHKNQQPIEPIEAQLIDILLQHPEYHPILNNPETYQTKDFADENPFLHLSLHMALREQIQTNRPVGIQAIYQRLCTQYGDNLVAEHLMMPCLEECLWEGQRRGTLPDEQEYLEKLRGVS